MIAPKAMRVPTPPTVEPRPVEKDVKVSVKGMPATRARTAEPSVRARKGWTFFQTIRTMIVVMPARAAPTSCSSLSECTTALAAAPRRGDIMNSSIGK